VCNFNAALPRIKKSIKKRQRNTGNNEAKAQAINMLHPKIHGRTNECLWGL